MLRRKLFVMTIAASLLAVAWAGAQSAGRPVSERSAARTSPQTSAAADSSAGQPQLATPAQTGSNAPASVPRLIRFSGILQNLAGRAISGPVDVTFSLYAEQAGGSALWFETQTVQADALGRYSALLGAMSPAGVPIELFTDSQARWLGVMIQGLPEQSRVLLVSVPYALKAGDAETLGGRPAADYQLTPDSTASTDSVAKQGTTTTRGGAKKATGKTGSPTPQTLTATQNYIPVMTANDGSLGNSVMYQSGGFIGVGTTAPAFPFDLNSNVFAIGPKASLPGAGGTMRFRDDTGTVRWLFGIPGSAGSQDFFIYNNVNGHAPLYIQGGAASYSIYMSGNGRVGIGTTTPAAKLDVIGSMRVISGSSIAAAPQFTLGGLGFVGMSVAPMGLPPAQLLALQTDPMGALGYTPNGGSTYPFYVTAAGQATIGGTLTIPATTGSGVGVITLGTMPFVHGCCSATAYNSFIGGAGNFTTTGSTNVGVGDFALQQITTGGDNTAAGFAALQQISGGNANTAIGRAALVGNSTGSYNTAIGQFVLAVNTTGISNTGVGATALDGLTTGNFNTALGEAAGGGVSSGQYNTALGYSAGTSGNFNNSTAIGALARVGASNTIVLGSINGVNGATSNVNVGIGTTTPISPLQVATGDIVIGPTTALPYSNTNGLYVTNDAGDAKNTFRLDAYQNDLTVAGFSASGAAVGTTITFRTAAAGAGEFNRVRINSSGYLGIGTMSPAYPLDVVGDIHTTGCVMYNGGASGSCATPSDQRLKKNIQPFGLVLDRLVALRPVHYEWNPANPPKYRFSPGRNAGLIAQDVERVFPEMVTTGEDGYKKVYYNELPYLLLAGVRELKTQNDELKAKVSTLEIQNQELIRDAAQMRQAQSQMAALEARLARLESKSNPSRVATSRPAKKSRRPARNEVARLGF